MKQYTLKVIINEGRDEFWETIPSDNSGCDDVLTAIRGCLSDHGFMHGENCSVTMSEFKNIKEN